MNTNNDVKWRRFIVPKKLNNLMTTYSYYSQWLIYYYSIVTKIRNESIYRHISRVQYSTLREYTIEYELD